MRETPLPQRRLGAEHPGTEGRARSSVLLSQGRAEMASDTWSDNGRPRAHSRRWGSRSSTAASTSGRRGERRAPCHRPASVGYGVGAILAEGELVAAAEDGGGTEEVPHAERLARGAGRPLADAGSPGRRGASATTWGRAARVRSPAAGVGYFRTMMSRSPSRAMTSTAPNRPRVTRKSTRASATRSPRTSRRSSHGGSDARAPRLPRSLGQPAW
jgi:hypothetical protein